MLRPFLTAAAAVTAIVLSTALPSGMAQAQDAASDSATVREMALGPEDAAVTVIEYASFTCPHCANFHDTVFGDLKADYIDTGKIRFIHREVYFDRYGLWASMVARCGGGERYFGIVDILYENQREWTAGSDPAVVVGNLRRIGKTAGLTDEQLDVCLSDAAKAEALVGWFEANASADDVSSTPTFIVNGEKHGNMSYADFSSLLDDELDS